MTTCLIFGGNGFIGSHVAERLVKKGYNIKVFDSFIGGIANLEMIKDRIEIIKGDLLNDGDVRDALKDTDYVFHYISTTVPATARKNPIYDIESNIIGSVKLFQNAVNNNIKKVIFSSSGGTIYGEPSKLPLSETDPTNPVDPYGISKLTIEKYLNYFNYACGLEYVILRYSNPYGERQNPYGIQGVIPVFLNKIRKGERPVIYGDGSMVRDYIYIKDAIDATISIFESNTKEKVFNIGTGDGTSLNELIEVMSKIVGEKITPQYINNDRTYIHKIVLDISKMRNEIGWEPTISLDEGIRRTWRWINATF